MTLVVSSLVTKNLEFLSLSREREVLGMTMLSVITKASILVTHEELFLFRSFLKYATRKSVVDFSENLYDTQPRCISVSSFL